MPLRTGPSSGRELANAGGCPAGLVCTNEIGCCTNQNGCAGGGGAVKDCPSFMGQLELSLNSPGAGCTICSVNGCPALAGISPTHINILTTPLDATKSPYQGKNVAYGGLIACAAHTTAFQQIAVVRDLPIPLWYRTDFNDPSSFNYITTTSTYMPATDPQTATGSFHNSPDNGLKATDYPSVVMITGDDVTTLNAMVARCSGVCVSNPFCSYVSYGFEQGAYFCKLYNRDICSPGQPVVSGNGVLLDWAGTFQLRYWKAGITCNPNFQASFTVNNVRVSTADAKTFFKYCTVSPFDKLGSKCDYYNPTHLDAADTAARAAGQLGISVVSQSIQNPTVTKGWAMTKTILQPGSVSPGLITNDAPLFVYCESIGALATTGLPAYGLAVM